MAIAAPALRVRKPGERYLKLGHMGVESYDTE